VALGPIDPDKLARASLNIIMIDKIESHLSIHDRPGIILIISKQLQAFFKSKCKERVYPWCALGMASVFLHLKIENSYTWADIQI
jgi:hypothetical protein